MILVCLTQEKPGGRDAEGKVWRKGSEHPGTFQACHSPLICMCSSKIYIWASLGTQMVKCLPVMQETGSQFLGWEDPLKKKGNPLQHSCLENPIVQGAWWATVHGVAKSQTQLSDFTFTSLCVCIYIYIYTHTYIYVYIVYTHFSVYLKHCKSTMFQFNKLKIEVVKQPSFVPSL